MRRKRNSFLGATFLLVFLTLGCSPDVTGIPTVHPTQAPARTQVPTPERTDIPIYRNYFEGSSNQVFKGISGWGGDLRINTGNVDYQSGIQSLEAYGTLPGSAWSTIGFSFSMEEVTGEKMVDLSNKTIGFSYYLPVDSPIGTIVLVAVSEKGQVQLANVRVDDFPQRDLYGSWHSERFDIQSITESGAWTWSDLSAEDARQVIRNTSELLIVGMRPNVGDPLPATFLIDNLRWIRSDNLDAITLDEDTATLRNYADIRGLKVSSILTNDPYQMVVNYDDPWYRHTLATQFNMMGVGSGNPPMEKPTDISALEFDYTLADKLLDFAKVNNMALFGGTGGWHTGNPRWITDGTYDELKAFLDRKIESDISHYSGKVLYWGVFNEILDSGGVSLHNRQAKDPGDVLYGTEWAPYGGRYSPYVDGNDTSLIEFAFIKARSVDPDAGLLLNESGVEEYGTPRSEYFYNLVLDMKNRGVPIDGVSIQLHLIYPNSPAPGSSDYLVDTLSYLDGIDRNVKHYAEAGLLIAFSEFECQIRLDDIDLNTQAGKEEYFARQRKQAEIYAGIVRIVRDNPNVAFINFWSVSDLPLTSAYDWRGMGELGSEIYPFVFTDAFLFDKNYEPKSAFDAVMEVLKP